MSMIQADPESIRNAAQQFSQQSVALADLIGQVTSDMDNLVGLWSGNAYTQFTELMSQWHTDIQGVQSILETVAKQVDNAGLGYSDLDSQISRSFQL